MLQGSQVSALDHLACQLVYASDNTPNRGTQFPICSQRPEDGLKIAGGVSGEVIDVVDDLQPYKYGDNAATPLGDLG